MKSKHWIKRDFKARQSLALVEAKRLTLKSLLSNVSFPWGFKFYWSYLLQKSGLKNRLAFLRRGCLWSGSGRSVFKFFKFSRHWCKHFASMGILTGMRKSSF